MNTVEELRSKAVPLLRPYARKISLFGSFARQDNSRDSDIDLLVELKHPAHRPVLGLRWFSLEGELGRMMGRKIELFSETELSPHLKNSVDWDTVLLYEEN